MYWWRATGFMWITVNNSLLDKVILRPEKDIFFTRLRKFKIRNEIIKVLHK